MTSRCTTQGLMITIDRLLFYCTKLVRVYYPMLSYMKRKTKGFCSISFGWYYLLYCTEWLSQWIKTLVSIWSEVKWSDMTWRDVTWLDVTWHDMLWCEVKPSDMAWREVKWSEARWSEVKWSEMKWKLLISSTLIDVVCLDTLLMWVLLKTGSLLQSTVTRDQPLR